MLFKEIKVGEFFKVKNVQYKKVPVQKKSCCQIKCNAKRVDNDADAVFKPADKVEKIS